MQRYPDQDKLMEQLRQDIIEVLRGTDLEPHAGHPLSLKEQLALVQLHSVIKWALPTEQWSIEDDEIP